MDARQIYLSRITPGRKPGKRYKIVLRPSSNTMAAIEAVAAKKGISIEALVSEYVTRGLLQEKNA